MNTSETLDAIRKAMMTPVDIAKAGGITQATGLINYDLQRPALFLTPWGKVVTPLRNEIPRVKGDGGTATNWRAITGINTTRIPAGVSEGNRNAYISQSVVTRTSSYIGIGFENYATFESEYAAEGFDDADARAVQAALRSLMISEEQMIVGGNQSVALGTTPTPTGTGSATLGALPDGTYYVGCVALTHDGWLNATVTAGVVQTISRTNADGSTDTLYGGTAQPSVLSSGVTLNAGTSAQRVTAHVAPVTGAIAYAWYLGSSNTHQYLQQITTINSVNFNTALVTSARQDFQTLAATDNSKNVVNGTSYTFDGILYTSAFAGTGAYFASLATGTDGVGTVLTSDTAGGVNEINTAFKSFWDNYRLSPDTLWVNSQEANSINKIVIAGGGAPLFRYNMDAKSENFDVTGGVVVGSLMNKFTNQAVRVRVHPWVPPGTIMFTSKEIGAAYPMSGLGNVLEIRYRQDYYQTLWPLRTRKREFGVYADEVLIGYFLPAFGAITNIAAS